MYDAVAVVGRFQGGPHKAHEALFRFAASHVKAGGTLVVFVGSAQCPREPANPFFWHERALFLQPVLQRICDGISYQVIPLRDFIDNHSWANALLESLRKVTGPDGSLAICDANKNGTESNYANWFHGRLSYIPFPLQEGISATPYRGAFFRTGMIPDEYRNQICPETLGALEEWKTRHLDEFCWLQQELLFGQLPDTRARQVNLCREHVLMYQRLTPPGRHQFHLPTVTTGISVGRNRPNVLYPSQLLRDPESPKFKRSFRRDVEVLGISVQLWEFLVDGHSSLPELSGTLEEISPRWVPFQELSDTPLFGKTLFLLEGVLGPIVV